MTRIDPTSPFARGGNRPFTELDERNLSLGAGGFVVASGSGVSATSLGDSLVTGGGFPDPTVDLAINGDFADALTDLVTNGDFATALTNSVVNGAFTGNATGWVLETGWTYGTNKVTKTAGIANSMYLAERPYFLRAGKNYRVTYAVSGRTAGAVTMSIGDTDGTPRSSDATFVEDLLCTGVNPQLKFTADATFDGAIDTVIVSDLLSDSTWTWELDEGWTLDTSGAKATCDGVLGGDITQSAILTVGKKYRTIYTVSGWSAGTITLNCGSGGTGTPRGSNATFSEDLLCETDGDLIFTADADFDGSIDDVIVYLLDESAWGWELDEAWTVDLANDYAEADGSSGAGDITQLGLALTVGNQYEVTYTVANRSVGGVTAKCGTGAGTEVVADATVTEIIECAGTGVLLFSADATFDGRIVDIIVFDLTAEMSWIYGDGWTQDTNKATNATGTAGDLTQEDIVVSGEAYRTVYTVSGWTQGTITLKLGTSAGTARGSNATFIEDIVSNGTDLVLVADADFDGSVDDIIVYSGNGSYFALMAYDGDAVVDEVWSWDDVDLPAGTLLEGVPVFGKFKMISVTSGKVLCYKADN